MKSLFPLMLVATVGCSGNDNKGQDMAVMDAAVPDQSGSAGDLKGSGGSCNILAQTGCNAGERCVAVMGGTMMNPMLVGSCAPDGTVAEGAACTIDNTGADDCKGATYCDNTGANANYLCRKFCAGDTGCTTAGQKCANFFNDKSIFKAIEIVDSRTYTDKSVVSSARVGSTKHWAFW